MMATFPARRWATPPTSMTRLSPASISATNCLCSLFFIWWSIKALRFPFLQAGRRGADSWLWQVQLQPIKDLQEAVQIPVPDYRILVHQG